MTVLTESQIRAVIDNVAVTVNPEPLRCQDCSEECEATFRKAIEAFEKQDFRTAARLFREAHRLLHLPPNSSSAALRDAVLASFHAGRASEAYEVMLRWYRRGGLFAAPLWNFAVAAVRTGRLPVALEALDEWLRAPVHHLAAQAHLLRAALLTLLERPDEAQEALQQAEVADAQYCAVALSKAGVTSESDVGAIPLDENTRKVLARRLVALLEPRKPDRYPQLNALILPDYQAISRSIDLARDDDFVQSLAVLDGITSSGTARVVRTWIEAAIRLQLGEKDKAQHLLAGVADQSAMPGSVWWNWASAAAASQDHAGCLSRLRSCVKTEYYTKPEAWAALAVSAVLVGDSYSAAPAAARAWASERGRLVLAEMLREVEPDKLKTLGILVGTGADPSARPETVLDRDALARALDGGNMRAAVTVLASVAPQLVTNLPEYEAAPLEPDFVTSVPRSLIRRDMQGEFRQGLQALLSAEFGEAVTIFARLADTVPSSSTLRVNWAAALYGKKEYVASLERLQELAETSTDAYGDRHIVGVLACLVALEQYDQAVEVLTSERCHLHAASCRLYQAVVAETASRSRDLAEHLFDLVRTLESPSLELLALSAVRCADAKDWTRTTELARAVISGEPVAAATAGSTIGSRTSECRTHAQMKEAYERFQGRGDWRAAVDFFRRVKRAKEEEFYGSSDSRRPSGLLNAQVLLASALTACGRKREAHEVLRNAMQIMQIHREDLDPSTECLLGEAVAGIYGRLQAPLRELEALQLAQRADPSRTSVAEAIEASERVVYSSPGLPAAVQNLGHCVLELRESAGSGLRPAKAALLTLCDALGIATLASQVHEVFAFLETVCTDGVAVEQCQVGAAASAVDEVVLGCCLHAPADQLEPVEEALSHFEEFFGEVAAECTRPPCQLRILETWHDGTNATALVVCQLRTAREVTSINGTVGNIRGLQATGGHRATFEVGQPVRGRRYYVPLRFGITQDWAASERVQIPVSVVTGEGATRTRKYSSRMMAEFRPYQEANAIYPGGAIGPEDVDGAPLYGRQELVARLARSLLGPRQNRLYFLSGARKVGKTSVLRFVQQEIRLQAPRHLCALVNLDREWPQAGVVAHVAAEVVRAARRDFELEACDVLSALPEDWQCLGEWLRQVKSATGADHVVLMLDEFGRLINEIAKSGKDGASLGDLRYLWSEDKVASLLMADWRTLDELSATIAAQFWADVTIERVGFLGPRATAQAVSGPLAATMVRFTDDASDLAFHLTQGYPWHIQELCSFAIRRAGDDLRHTVLSQDVEQAADRLVRDARTFEEGLFRTDRQDKLTAQDEQVLWKICRYVGDRWQEVPTRLFQTTEPALTPEVSDDSLKRLAAHGILVRTEQGVQLCSPLVARWLHAEFSAGKSILGAGAATQSSLPRLGSAVLEEDANSQVGLLVDALWAMRRRINSACQLLSLGSPFQMRDTTEQQNVAKEIVVRAQKWDPFIGSLKVAFVDDAGNIDAIREPQLSTLTDSLHQLRLRRNYTEHKETASRVAVEVELEHRKRDLGALEPSSPSDWQKLQIGLLAWLKRQFELQLAVLDPIT